MLHGYHRDFCIYSHRYRGTPQRPGLVLGLNRGGSCRGMAYRVHGRRAHDTLDYLWDREMVTGVYEPRRLKLRLAEGMVQSWTFVADRHHVQYAGGLDLQAKVALIVQGHGRNGACRDYLANTVRHLDELGIADGPLHRLLALVERHRAETR
jgi:cation transport protein ChaC